jgi:hypothetical protein
MSKKKQITAQAHNAAQTGEIAPESYRAPWHGVDWTLPSLPVPTLEKIPVYAEAVGDLPEISRSRHNPFPLSRNTDALWTPLHYAPPRVTCPDCQRNDTWWPLAIVTVDVEAICVCYSGLTTVTTLARLKGGVARGDAEWEIVKEEELS